MLRSAAFLAVSMIATTVLAVRPVWAEDPSLSFFEKQVRPVLIEHCYSCHSTTAKKLSGGLLLDSRDGIRKGGESGKVIEPGNPADSLLIKALRYTDNSIKMPPKGKLPASVVADLETWVKSGAYDPRETPPRAKANESWAETLRQRRDWWSLKPVQMSAPPHPKIDDASQERVDRFILARLEAAKLTPADPADPSTLIRRLSLVLTGLPPTSEQIDHFLSEVGELDGRSPSNPQAVGKLVDSLLASPSFGERWARHWMDVVRFSETHGNEWNYEVHHAWRYRDYLIRAFNADVPYDQLVREHIAGDLLPNPRLNEREKFNESIIGTGFYRFGEANHDDCISLRQIGYDLADNQIDTLTKAFQATTVACARCHNHKFDAVSTNDYHALLGIVRSSRLVSHSIDAHDVDTTARHRLRGLKSELRQEIARVWLDEARQFSRFMQEAYAQRVKRIDASRLKADLDGTRLDRWIAILTTEPVPCDDPFEPWRALALAGSDADFSARWRVQVEQFAKEDHERTEFNRTRFVTFADFRGGSPAVGWQVQGRGLADASGRSGDFVIHPIGDAVVRAILPSGQFTHTLSDKLNGTLRSPVLPDGKAYISFQVQGEHSSAVRLVSNNCQLNYKNYQALTSADLHWVTFSPPADRVSLRTYAELMTMFDNPKFPDQLSALGGDKENYRLPWELAANNPRSHFGITRVVLHDAPESPKPELSHQRRLFAGADLKSLNEFADRYATITTSILQAWATDKTSDDDVRWLDTLLRRGLLGNGLSQSARLTTLIKAYRSVEAELSLPRVIAGVSDGGPGLDQPVFLRGDCTRPGETIPRRYLEVLSGSHESFTSQGSGRLELAAHIASAENPLTARVMVNRIWHHLFGTGLVRSVDDFGHVGELPSHPELLDYLAARFVADGWSVKRLIRLLVLTKTFQQSSKLATEASDRDPQNRLLQHYPARRMEAEAVRDAILFASGRLDRRLYGMSVQPFREKSYADRRLFPGPLDGDGRRSIYIKNNLMEAPKFLAAFDFPGSKVTQGRRDVTNVPAQALALLNDPFVLQQADVWAGQLLASGDSSIDGRLQRMFQTGLSRPPTDQENLRFRHGVLGLAELHHVQAGDVLKSRPVWKDVAHVILNLSEFRYIP